MALVPRFDGRDTAARARGHGHRGPAARDLRGRSCGTTGSATSTPTCSRTARSSARGQRQDGRDHGRVERHRPAAALKVAAAGGIPLLVARTAGEARGGARRRSRRAGGTAYVYTADLSDYDSIDRLVEKIFADHASIDVLVNNAGRSIRRSVALSYDRFHDYERTIKLNYLGTIKLILGLLPHMREQEGRPHRQRLLDRRADEPAALLAPTSRRSRRSTRSRASSSSETIGDNVTFTTIHMPLVRTAMIAPTKMYDSFPTISPDEAADLICEAIRGQAEADQHEARDVRRGALRARAEGRRPDPAHGLQGVPGVVGREGRHGRTEDRASGEATALAHLMRGVHW